MVPVGNTGSSRMENSEKKHRPPLIKFSPVIKIQKCLYFNRTRLTTMNTNIIILIPYKHLK